MSKCTQQKKKRFPYIAVAIAVLAVLAVIAMAIFDCILTIKGWHMLTDVLSGRNSLTGVPENLKNHIIFKDHDKGDCRTLTGDILLTVIFADDTESTWDDGAMEEKKQALDAAAALLLEDAEKYGVELNFSVLYLQAQTDFTMSMESTKDWANDLLQHVGLSSVDQANRKLENLYDVKEAPVIFYVNRTGRAFSRPDDEIAGGEYTVLYANDTDFRHELNHLFGAGDYYYPEEYKAQAEIYFSDSIMLSCDTGTTDSLTAYLIGWTEELSTEALAFLKETAHITEEQMAAERDWETYTGYDVRQIGNGIYSGEFLEGNVYGKGKMEYQNGDYYEGDWVYGTRHGFGTYHWANGSVYVGEWKDGEIHGQGTMTYASGTVKSGMWENGEFIG